MTEDILYSFVLPAYKAHFFRKAIDSILNQSYKNFELIIVNDKSPDDLDSIVKSYNDPRIHYYINEENIGGKDLVSQWNHCISYASGTYLILASDDDEYHPQYLEKMNVLVKKYPNANVYRPRVQYINENGDILRIGGILNEYSAPIEFIYYLEHIGKGIPFYIFNKEALNKIGGFVKYPLAWHSDDMTVIQMARNGIIFCSDILFSMRISGENISSKKNDANILSSKTKATIQYFKDLRLLIQNYNVKSTIDAFFHHEMNNLIIVSQASNLKSWFMNSTKSAVCKRFPLIWQSKLISRKTLIKMYFQKLLH